MNQLAFVLQEKNTKSREVSFVMGNIQCERYAKMLSLTNSGFSR